MSNSGESPNLREQSIQGGAWAAIGAAGSSALSFVNFLLLSRFLGPETYGVMAMVEASLALGERLMSNGLSEPLIQMQRLDPDHSDTLFWTLQVFGLGSVAAMIGLSGVIGRYFMRGDLPLLIAAASVTLYLQACGLVPRALLARSFRFSDSAQAAVVSELLGGVAAIAWALTGHGVWSLVLQRIVADLVETMVLWRKAAWRPRMHWSARRFDELWRFSASRGLEGILGFVDQQVPRIILGRVAGPRELGHFVFARRIVENTVTLLNSPIKTTALSAFAVIQTDLDRVRRTYAEGVTLTTSAVFPACAGIALIAPYFVPLMVGERWGPSVLLLQLLVLASIRQSFHIWNTALLRGLGKPQLLLAASFVRTSVILTLIFLLLPWGAVGTCVAILAGSYLSWPVAIALVRRVTGIRAFAQLRPGAVPLLATAIMAAVVASLRQAIAARLSLTAAVAVLSAAGVMVYLAGLACFGREQLASFARIARSLGRMSGRPFLPRRPGSSEGGPRKTG
jgi:O-antigen/teichoic acid export membrane protein